MKSLKELKDEKIINYGNPGGGYKRYMPTIEQVILLNTEFTLDKRLRLNCIGEGENVTIFIRSEKKELLENIQKILKNMGGKSMDKILYEKNIIYET